MNFSKQEIIKIFLENDLQLDDDSLNYFLSNQDKINLFFQAIKDLKEKPLVVTKQFVEKTLFKEPRIEILKKFSQPTGVFSTGDIMKFFQERYEFVRKKLEKRVDLINTISINRISKKTRKFSIIGMVNERNEEEKSIEVSDLTGTTTIFLDKKIFDILPVDTVAGFVCEKKDDKITAENVIFPDVPLKKEISKTSSEAHCLFVSDFHLNSSKNDFFEKFLTMLKSLNLSNLSVFFLGDISSKKDDYRKIIESIPEKISCIFLAGELEKNIEMENIFKTPILIQIGEVKIFLAHGDFFSSYLPFFKTPENTILQLLKQRNFNPTFSPENFSNTFLLDTLPDIIAIGHFHNPIFQNYKGITIIINGSFVTQPIYWLVNLQTREINKFSLI
jgi:DNA polymerase II small subunit/DNA polymerase delta subunit B